MRQKQDIQRTLLGLIRLGIDHYSDSLLDYIDWNAVRTLADEQGLSAVVLDGIEKAKNNKANLNINQELLLEWIGEVMQNYEARYQQYKKAIADLAGFYNSHGYKMMVLKGYACSLDWPKPEHRPCGDIDIWQFGKQEEADETLRQAQGAGFKIEGDQHHHTIFYWRDFMVENHYDFVNVHAHQSSKEMEKIFKELGSEDNVNLDDNLDNVGKQIRSVVVNGEKVYLPSPDLHALFLLRHMASHFAAEGINLRQVMDWGFFVEKHTKEIDWDWLLSIADKYHMKDFFNCINAICVEDLGFSVSNLPVLQFPPFLKDRIFQDIISPMFKHEPPSFILTRLVFKYKRWKANEWKRSLCYNESGISNLLSSLWAHLIKPQTI